MAGVRERVFSLLGLPRADSSPSTTVARVSVLLSGRILLDGKEIRLGELKRILEKLKTERGAVWYYRESAKGEPPREAVEVFKLMVESKLPLSLSSKSDFSDFIDDEGQSHPRR